jgi:peroxiredoxin
MRRADPVILALLALSLSANVYLYRLQPASVPVITPLEAGERVPEFAAKGLGGEHVDVRFRTRPVVLYTFSPTCGWCERNLDNAREVARRVAGRYDFIGVALDSRNAEHYLRERQLGWRVIKDVPADVKRAYRMAGTPQTIVIGIGGVVRKAWSGAYDGKIASDVEEFFGLTLPGLMELDRPTPKS